MTDIKSPEDRSRNMAAIRSRDTKPEIYLRKVLFAKGYRYRIASSTIPGHPDIYMAKYNLAIFIHGCFWHRHAGCKYSYIPKSRIEFWNKKFENNIKRDNAVREQLASRNIRCLIVWECAIKQAKKKSWSENSLFEAVIRFIHSEKGYREISMEDILQK